jgi:hypothetical protein
MFAPAAIAKTQAVEQTLVAGPARRSTQAARRGLPGIGGSFLDGLRSSFANAADEITTPWLPRIINYPY